MHFFVKKILEHFQAFIDYNCDGDCVWCIIKVDETLARTAETADRLQQINAHMDSVTNARQQRWPNQSP